MILNNRYLFAVVATVLFAVPTLAAGEVDTTFSASAYGIVQPAGYFAVVESLPDGKMLVGGEFTEIQGHASPAIARLNADGTIDSTFNPPDFYSTFGIGGTVRCIVAQPDGKILVGGSIQGVSGVDTKLGIRRLHADGSLDTAFFVYQWPVLGNNEVYDIELQADGKILVAGKFRGTSANLLRLNADGTRDTSFENTALGNTTTIYDVVVTPDGKIIAGGTVGHDVSDPLLIRFNSNGTVDNTFAQITSGDSVIEAVALQTDGKIVIGGSFNNLNGTARNNVTRVNANGTFDVTFSPGGSGANGRLADIVIQPDGKIIIAGSFTTYNGTPRQRIARLNFDGTLDDTFQNSGTATGISDIELLPDGRILAAGGGGAAAATAVLRYNSDGTFDPTLVVLPSRLGLVFKVLQQPDGKVLVSGQFFFAKNQIRYSLARFNADGTLDTSFVPYFNSAPGPVPAIYALALQPDGKILIGAVQTLLLKRLNSDGSHDASFSTTLAPNGTINDIDVLPNGQILVAGDGPIGFRRLQSNGATDTSFAVGQPQGEVYETLVQPDGRILIAGTFTHVGPLAIRGRIARLNAADGSLDNSFNPDEGANGTVHDISLQADGKVILGGNFTALNGNANIKRVGRLNSDGSLDASFVVQSPNAAVRAVKVQPDGKVLIGGDFFMMADGSFRRGIARLNANGSIDPSFITAANGAIYDIALQADGKILVGGSFMRLNGISSPRIGRLLNSIIPRSVLFDYDGDGKSDVSVFRPSENKWYVFRSSDSVVYQTIFAAAGDIPVPADYDGDQKTDVAIFRPSSADWWYLATSDGTQRSVHWGNTGDIARPSDFDGDGKADFIVFRSGENNWYRLGSTGVFSAVNFGLAGDKPVTGDFDADGKSDVAIYRPSTGDWWWQSSVDNIQRATHFGISTDTPTPADFDGDGKTDFAVYRASTGVWYILNSGTGQTTIQNFGLAEDKPVAADYDGDGRADIAVFRPSTSVWYLLRSTSGFTAMQFGVSTDIPTPNAFIP